MSTKIGPQNSAQAKLRDSLRYLIPCHCVPSRWYIFLISVRAAPIIKDTKHGAISDIINGTIVFLRRLYRSSKNGSSLYISRKLKHGQNNAVTHLEQDDPQSHNSCFQYGAVP